MTPPVGPRERYAELRTAIADNTVPGGSAYGRAAAEMIAIRAADTAEPDLDREVGELVAWLVGTKPSMTSMRTVGDLALHTLRASEAERGRVLVAEMERFIAESEASIASIADHAAEIIKPGATVLYHSYSGSLLQLLGRAAADTPDLTFAFTESRPYRESRRIAAALAGTDVRLVAYSDAAMAVAAAAADVVVVGADALFADGSFANKVGSLPLALACREAGTPFYVATEVSKLYAGDPADVAMEQRPAHEIADDDWELWGSDRVEVSNQFFERVPAALVTAYLTDRGVLRPDQLADRAVSGHDLPHPTRGAGQGVRA